MARITQTELEAYLWGAATALRGTIDAGDYKQYIFPLLFLKRLCDVYQEERSLALARAGEDYPEDHRFQIPHGCHWEDVRATTTDVGKKIQDATRGIEQANPDQLFGVFGDATWTNKERLPDRTLIDLVSHFSEKELNLANLPEDEFGQGYEYLIKKFADDSGHTAAEFYTNRTLVHLMTELMEPQPGESVYDPTCGTGGMLLSCVAHLRAQKQEYRTLKLYGQELNLITSAIARMNLFLHGLDDFHVARGDTLSEPKFLVNDRVRQFDVILANPPYSIKRWDREKWQNDPYKRNTLGTPPQGRADYAFLQHILASLAPKTGRCSILFPHGVLFRDEEREMREKLVESDAVECVLGLGPNLFYGSPMEACVLICRTEKPKARRDRVLFINAVSEISRERSQSFLKPDHRERIVRAYREFADEAGFSRVATRDEIRANGANLNIPLYVRTVGVDRATDRAALLRTVAEWRGASRSLRLSLDELIATLSRTAVDEPRPEPPRT